MKVSERGIFALLLHEGIVPAPYLDSAGVWTFGIGHTANAGNPDPAKMTRGNPDNLEPVLRKVFDVFKRDLAEVEARVNDAVKVPVKQHEFDALVSFDFNTGGIYRAKLTEHLNKGDRLSAGKAFMGWLRPPEIKTRRKSEQALFMRGEYPSGTVPVWGVTANNRPSFSRVASRLSQADVARYLGGTPAAAPRPALSMWTIIINALRVLFGRIGK